MKGKKLPFIVILALLFLGGLISWRYYLKVYSQQDTVNVHLFPKAVAGWVSEELTITDEEYDILETRNAFARKYTAPQGGEVVLFVVYSQSNRKVSHPPEVCYLGSGVSIAQNIKQKLDVFSPSAGQASDLLEINKLVLEKGPAQQLAYYWFKVGDTFTASYWKQQSLIAFNSLFNKPSSSAMIRISSTVKNADQQLAEGLMKEFIRNILPEIPQYLP